MSHRIVIIVNNGIVEDVLTNIPGKINVKVVDTPQESFPGDERGKEERRLATRYRRDKALRVVR